MSGANQKPPPASFGRILALWRSVRPPARPLVVALVTLVLWTAFSLLTPWTLKVLVDDVLSPGAAGSPPPYAHLLPGPKGARLLAVLAFGAIVTLGGALAKVRHARAKTELGLATVVGLRSLVFAHLQRLSLGFHDRQRTGELANRLTANTYALWTLAESLLFGPGGATLTLGGALALMMRLDWRLALVSLATAPPLFMTIRRYARRSHDVARDYHDREGELSAHAHEALGAIRVIQAFTREDDEQSRFDHRSGSITEARLGMVDVDNRFALASDLLLGAGVLAIMGAGALSVMDGRLTIGELLVFVSYAGMLYAPLSALSYLAGSISGARAALDRVVEVLDELPEVGDLPGASPFSQPVRGEVELRSVAFDYSALPKGSGASPATLSEVDLRAAPGEVVAIVGPTGAGKSTLVSLIPRFYDPSRGEVRIDGRDIRDLPLRELRRETAIVLQETLLFDASVRENIGYGRPGASAAEIGHAALLARADEFIRSLPQGYDTRVGERGVRLSGGERQRIAIARAFLRDAPILILDEPTAALDASTESDLMESLCGLMGMGGPARAGRRRTTFLVTHRLALAQRADRVVVLAKGRVVEQGPPDELLAHGGAFAALVRAGNGGPRDPGLELASHPMPHCPSDLTEIKARSNPNPEPARDVA